MTTSSVRLVRKGDTVVIEDSELVVSKVEVVLFLSNGATVSLDPSDTIEIVPREELSEDLIQQIEELRSAEESVQSEE